MTGDSSLIDVHDLAVDLDGHPVLWNISFSVVTGRFLGIIGPNGAGKTTLLRVLLGLIAPSRGSVVVLGRSPMKLGRHAHQIGYVPQRPQFDTRFPVSVRDVVMMGRACCLGLFRIPRREDWRKVDESIGQVGLSGYEHQRIGELSGGEQQRAFIARALCAETRLLLLDEPTIGLDTPAQQDLYALLQRLRRYLGLTVVAVSHDLLELGVQADELICINGTAHIHGHPQTVLQSPRLREAYRCEFDFLIHEAGTTAPHND
jgi:zinc transport system ATP-binding protein